MGEHRIQVTTCTASLLRMRILTLMVANIYSALTVCPADSSAFLGSRV